MVKFRRGKKAIWARESGEKRRIRVGHFYFRETVGKSGQKIEKKDVNKKIGRGWFCLAIRRVKREEKKVGYWFCLKGRKAKEGWGIVEQKKREKGLQVCHSGGQAVTFSFMYFMF